MPVDGLAASIERMRRIGTAEYAVASFATSYDRLRAGERGLLAERDIEPLDWIPDLGDDVDDRALDRVAIIKLNGGLATSMAADAGKGLLEVKSRLTFIDLAARQAEALRRRTSCRLPLILMNSAATGPATAAARAGNGSRAAARAGRLLAERAAPVAR